MSTDAQPIFYFDLGSPYAWLAAERIHHVLPVVAVWQPILLGGIWRRSGGRSWAETDRREQGMREIERRAKRYELLPVKWPEPWPASTLGAMRAATFAQQAGRTVAFSLAAFRQAFAGGKDLSEIDNVLIAAAACELHPNAVLKAIEQAESGGVSCTKRRSSSTWWSWSALKPSCSVAIGSDCTR